MGRKRRRNYTVKVARGVSFRSDRYVLDCRSVVIDRVAMW